MTRIPPPPPREIAAGYAFAGAALELGAVVLDGAAHPDALVRVPLAMLNRHGLIAGATGTGKTKTLQLLAEQLSAAGVPVVVADIKGDLSGLAAARRDGRPDRPAGRRHRRTTGRRRPSRSSSWRSAASAPACRCAPR